MDVNMLCFNTKRSPKPLGSVRGDVTRRQCLCLNNTKCYFRNFRRSTYPDGLSICSQECGAIPVTCATSDRPFCLSVWRSAAKN